VPQIIANDITLEYDTFGSPADRPLLLVMGLGAQLIHWREEFCEQLAGHGHYVIRFDNRDAGLSEKFGHLGRPNVMELVIKAMQDEPVEAPYSLDDLADDAFGILDELGIDQAHVCGASMGGMVAQAMAIRAPARIRTLTSIMASTGNPELPFSREEALAALLAPAARDREEAIERAFRVSRVLGSPAYPVPEEDLKRRAAEAYDRSFYPEGFARQIAAVAAHGNRRPALEQLDVPAFVVHGSEDPLVPVEGGVDTHEALKRSRLLVLEGMGHDLPEPVWPEVIRGIAELTARHH
jgi:pimeloyl-ACP methyl ester carboxylesterase